MTILKRVLFLLLFLAVWLGALWIYVSNSNSPSEVTMLIISAVCLVVFYRLSRRIFKGRVDIEVVTAVTTAQIVGSDSFDNDIGSGVD